MNASIAWHIDIRTLEDNVFKPLDDFIHHQAWLDAAGGPLQEWINGLFSRGGGPGKNVKNFLNGTWLGHPLHPVITDVPIGAWICTFVLDSAASISDSREMRTAADITLATGLIASIGAASTGWTDWSDTYGKDRKVGLLHGLTMATAVATYGAALVARVAGARRAGVILSNTGLAVASAGAYLGGDEVFDLGYGVNRTSYNQGPSDFVPVLSDSELESNKPTKVDAEGRSVMLVKQGGQVFALDDTCVHAGCSLSGGSIEGSSIVCPCHGSQYELASGAVINGPATRPEPTLAVRRRNGMIEVKGE
jgi:nitrite reductase/ring-hydroxylating ferredoxin subunit/uncharacterized membrane protein